MEARGVPNVPTEYDAGINRGLGLPAGFYHFAFEAGSEAALADKRKELRTKGVDVTDIVDHEWSKLIYFKDPNGLSLEYCCVHAGALHGGACCVGSQQHDARRSLRGTIGSRQAQTLIYRASARASPARK
jgi:hypothetical protein